MIPDGPTQDPSCLPGLGALCLLALVIVLLIFCAGCTITYSDGAWTAAANGREIGRAIQILADK